MRRVWKIGGLVLAGVLAVALFALLGGSFIYQIGGARALDVSGSAPIVQADPPAQTGWGHYGGDAGGARWSSLDEIDRDTVGSLERAWSFSTGDMDKRPPKALARMAAEATPVLADGRLVFCTPFNEVIALEPGSGTLIWRYDPQIDLDQRPANQFVCRGVAVWHDESGAGRVFMGTNDGRLIALSLEDGAPVSAFGAAGEVAIDPGMPLTWPGEFQITSPPVVIGQTVIIGSAISDNGRVAAPVGAVRAYDARSGSLKWTFDPIPRDPQAATAADWPRDWGADGPPVEGHANAWAPLSVDAARGLVFVPTSSPSPDFYGGLRPGDNRHANSVVALEAETGTVRWAFQTVHHDVWDYDVPAQPSLVTITEDGRTRDAVAQVTKTGLVFVLDRETGAPLIPFEERPVPQGGAPGEALSPTQPFPVAPSPLVPDRVSANEAWGVTWFDKAACARKIAALDADGLFTPPSVRGMLMRPFSGGGANWGGAAFDPGRNLLIVNMNNLAHHIQLIPADEVEHAEEVMHEAEIGPQTGAPYGVRRELLVSPLGLPCTPPPWGVLAAVDLSTGELVWRRTLGTVEDLSGGWLRTELGTPNFGGPIVTAGGLVFIAATMDDYLRAFDVETGEQLWRARLSAGGQATPMTYAWQGRQYVVIYAGGHATAGTRGGDTLLAFALAET